MNGPTLLVAIVVVVSFLILLKFGSWIGGIIKRAAERDVKRYEELKRIDGKLTEIKNDYARRQSKGSSTNGQKK